MIHNVAIIAQNEMIVSESLLSLIAWYPSMP